MQARLGLAAARTDLATIPTLYDTKIPPASTDSPSDDFMGILAAGAQLYALDSAYVNPYTQVATNRSSRSGTFNTTVDGDVTTKLKYISWVLPSTLKQYAGTLTNVARFVAQAAAQHTIAYPPLLGIVDFDTEYQVILAANKPTSATVIDPVKAAVRKTTGIDLDRVAAAGAAAAAKHGA